MHKSPSRLFRSKPQKWLIFGAMAAFTAAFVVFYSGFFQSALAQEEGSAPPPAETSAPADVTAVAVSEAQKAVEGDLAVSPEAAKESSVDLKSELGLANYDPIVPDNFLGKVMYPLKNIAWDAQEGLYNAFASESRHAQLVQDHADKELVAAAKLFAADPQAGGKVVGILDEYKQDLGTASKAIPEVKKEDPNAARDLSAKIAENNMFVASKVLGSMQDTLLARSPESFEHLVTIKKEALADAGQALVAAADNETEVATALKTIATAKQATPFSGMVNAEFLSETKKQLGDQVGSEVSSAFDDAIKGQLRIVEDNLKTLPTTDQMKAESFGKFMAQLPGQSLERMKVMEQFSSQSQLPLVFLEKMQEAKAKIAGTIGEKIKNLVEDEVRKAVSEAMLSVKNADLQDFQVLNEFRDMVPDEEIRKEITQRHEEGVQKFLNRFGDDANARKVTEEFQTLTKKVEAGEIVPDANFFKTLDELKNRLAPEQQKFINDMENTGRQEMVDRMQNDPNFAERFASFNPADIQVFEKVKEGFGPQFGPPRGFNFEEKFREIEQQQAANFGKFLEIQNRPENVVSIRRQFETDVPPEIRQKFEQQYNFDAESFKKREELAGQKEEFFQKKFEEMRKEFEEKFGANGQQGVPQFFPGQPPTSFPGAASFGTGFPPPFSGSGQPAPTGPGGQPGQPPGQTSEGCPPGTIQGAFGCEFKFEKPEQTGPNCPPDFAASPFGCRPGGSLPGKPGESESGFDPARACSEHGGTWTGSTCQFSGQRGEPPREAGGRPPSGENFGGPSPEPFRPPTGVNQPPLPPEGFRGTTETQFPSTFVPPSGTNFAPPPGGFSAPPEGFQAPNFGFPPPPSGETNFSQPPPGDSSAPPPPSSLFGEPRTAGAWTRSSGSGFGIFDFLNLFNF